LFEVWGVEVGCGGGDSVSADLMGGTSTCWIPLRAWSEALIRAAAAAITNVSGRCLKFRVGAKSTRWRQEHTETHTSGSSGISWRLLRLRDCIFCDGAAVSARFRATRRRRARATIESRGSLGFWFCLVEARALHGSAFGFIHGEMQKLTNSCDVD
jgi:hypothetical protein